MAMMLHAILIGTLFGGISAKVVNVVLTQPEQVHLAMTGDPSEMSVTWVTYNKTGTPLVEYGTGRLTHTESGTTDVFTDGGDEKRVLYMHRVTLRNLKPRTVYVYHVGGPLGWSSEFSFRSLPSGTKWSPRVALYGDMGNKNAESLPRLQEETINGLYDAIFHVGDFAYNMDDDNARIGDAFMNQIQPIAAYLPYMTSVGNHENQYNFSNYKNRFTMPGGDGQGMFYSFNLGPAHIISFSSEFYYFLKFGFEQIPNQYKWMENDLKEANKPENRAKHPWIITMCHRPMYCSNSNDKEHCTNKNNLIRVGFPWPGHEYAMEDLLYKYGVDLHFQAHEHSYERLWPVYNRTVCNGTKEPYTNPQAPVHIVTGSSGCQEGVDPFLKVTQPWSAFHSDDYGYTRMHILNSTHLHLEQVSDIKEGQVIDKMMLIKSKHGAGTYKC